MATLDALVMSLARLMTVSRCSSYRTIASLRASKSFSSTQVILDDVVDALILTLGRA